MNHAASAKRAPRVTRATECGFSAPEEKRSRLPLRGGTVRSASWLGFGFGFEFGFGLGTPLGVEPNEVQLASACG